MTRSPKKGRFLRVQVGPKVWRFCLRLMCLIGFRPCNNAEKRALSPISPKPSYWLMIRTLALNYGNDGIFLNIGVLQDLYHQP